MKITLILIITVICAITTFSQSIFFTPDCEEGEAKYTHCEYNKKVIDAIITVQ